MEEREIVELFNNRDEKAVQEVDKKYKNYLLKVLDRMLPNKEDQMEALNDTYMAAWKSIPPNNPIYLRLYLARIAKNIAINVIKRDNSNKRISSQLIDVLDDMGEIVDKRVLPEDEVIQEELTENINIFLKKLPDLDRRIFIRRYWSMESIEEISKHFKISKSNVKVKLYRVRKKLCETLRKGGYDL